MTYYGAPHAFSDDEMALALTIARQLGFAIERLQAEEAKELLLGESRHRIKNVIATVQALASQTLAQDGLIRKRRSSRGSMRSMRRMIFSPWRTGTAR